MAVTLDQVRQWLDSDEPNYKRLAKLGIQLLPHLNTLIRGTIVSRAAKAASVAGLIDSDRAVELLSTAAKHPSPIVRLAAAGALRNMKRPAAAAVLMSLLADQDGGVRKLAIKSASVRPNQALIAKIKELGSKDPVASVRLVAGKLASQRGLA